MSVTQPWVETMVDDCARINDRLLMAAKALREGFEASIESANKISSNLGERMIICLCSTPNEKRMMHHRKKRIRKKYYNRVKRRVVRWKRTAQSMRVTRGSTLDIPTANFADIAKDAATKV